MLNFFPLCTDKSFISGERTGLTYMVFFGKSSLILPLVILGCSNEKLQGSKGTLVEEEAVDSAQSSEDAKVGAEETSPKAPQAGQSLVEMTKATCSCHYAGTSPIFTTEASIVGLKEKIIQQVESKAMPPNNTGFLDKEGKSLLEKIKSAP
jgi:hypothetical protein